MLLCVVSRRLRSLPSNPGVGWRLPSDRPASANSKSCGWRPVAGERLATNGQASLPVGALLAAGGSVPAPGQSAAPAAAAGAPPCEAPRLLPSVAAAAGGSPSPRLLGPLAPSCPGAACPAALLAFLEASWLSPGATAVSFHDAQPSAGCCRRPWVSLSCH